MMDRGLPKEMPVGDLKFKFLIIFFFFSLAQGLAQNRDPLKLAESLEQEKKYDQACALYEEWLKQNPTDPRLAAVLFHCVELKKNPLTAIQLLTQYGPLLKEGHDFKKALRQAGELSLLMGNYAQAYEYLRTAAQAKTSLSTEDEDWLLKAIFLAITVGDLKEAYELVKSFAEFIQGHGARAELNYALLEIYLLQNDFTNAERAWQILQKQFSDTRAYAKALFCLFKASLLQKDASKADAYYQALVKNFPASLEKNMAEAMLSVKDRQYSLAVTPQELLQGLNLSIPEAKNTYPETSTDEVASLANPTPSLPPSNTNSASSKRYAIQVGSYSVLENASFMVKDLAKLGFKAEIVKVSIKGKLYHRVLVGKDLTEDEAQTMLARLRDKGIDGWLVSSP